MMQSYFHDVADYIQESLPPGHQFAATLAAENSDFVRFNKGRIRQCGSVTQRYLGLDLIDGERHARTVR